MLLRYQFCYKYVIGCEVLHCIDLAFYSSSKNNLVNVRNFRVLEWNVLDIKKKTYPFCTITFNIFYSKFLTIFHISRDFKLVLSVSNIEIHSFDESSISCIQYNFVSGMLRLLNNLDHERYFRRKFHSIHEQIFDFRTVPGDNLNGLFKLTKKCRKISELNFC